MKSLNNLILAISVMFCSGLSATVLAASNQAATSSGFEASQFKLDMILAKRGDADAQYYLGTAYEAGVVTKKDLKQAFYWYGKAAEQNQPEAQYKVGYFYEHGIIVKRDMNKAMKWYKLATKSSSGTVRSRLHQQAFAHREDNKAPAKAEEKPVVKQEPVKKINERKLAEERKRLRQLEAKREQTQQRKQAEEHKRQQMLAQERARREAARKQQLAAAQHSKSVVKASTTQAAVKSVNIPDIADVVLNNKWRYGTESSDFLPSSTTHCLRASGTEIICFSDEKQRVINDRRVTYSTKSTLTNFKSDGSFQVKYFYNAIDMGTATSQGASVDPRGLKLVKGWQEPELVMNCRTTDRINLYCSRGSVKLHYRH